MTTNQTIDGVLVSRFLTDALTAAGMVRHGKQDKKFAERLADGCVRVRSAWLTKQPAPVAVVLPERLPGDDGVCTESHYASGWNDCLDELKRLNPSL